MSLDDFKFLSILGDGAYSVVYKVAKKQGGKHYALKKVKIAGLSEKEKENALNEVRILASINSPYVISYKESFIDADSESLCLVIEYADNGDLFQAITNHQNQETYFDEDIIWWVFL